MNMYSSMFCSSVCFLKIIHTQSCKPLLYRGVIEEFARDFNQGDHQFMIQHNEDASIFLDESKFDVRDEIDYIDHLLRMSSKYPYLVQLSALIPSNFLLDENNKVISFQAQNKSVNQWVWVQSMEQASILAIEFAELVHSNSLANNEKLKI